MLRLGKEKANNLLEVSVSLYPKILLPENKGAWNIGHRCLNYFFYALPWHKLLLPSYLTLVLRQSLLGMRPALSKKQLKILKKASSIGDEALDKLRLDKCVSIQSIKNHGAANCHEFAHITYDWLKKHGVNAHVALCYFMENGEVPYNKHQFVFYTLPGTTKLSGDEIMQNLTNPNVWILDLWLGRCGSAQEIINAYAQSFVVLRDGEYQSVAEGMDFVIHTGTKETDVYPNIYPVGKVEISVIDAGKVSTIKIRKNPPCYQQDYTIDKLSYEERRQLMQKGGSETIGKNQKKVFQSHWRWKRVLAPWERRKQDANKKLER